MHHQIYCEVKVLFVKVCVPVSVTSPVPKPMSIILGLVPSFAEANTILVAPLATATLSPDPEIYLNSTV